MKAQRIIKYVIIIAVVMLASNTVKATEKFIVDDITYEIVYNEPEVKVILVPNKEDITIPESVIYDGKKYMVTIVESNSFDNCRNLRSLTLPTTLRYFWAELHSYYILRINISSLFDYMEMYVTESLFTSPYEELYLNGELVTSVDITNAEPQNALRGYKKLKSVTFSNTEYTSLTYSILDGCSDVDTICFKSPYTFFSTSDVTLPDVKYLYIYGNLTSKSRLNFNVKFAYLGGTVHNTFSDNYYNNLTADVCIINTADTKNVPKLKVDTCIITQDTKDKEFSTNGAYGNCKNLIFLSPTIKIDAPRNQPCYVIDIDSATTTWDDWDKKHWMKDMKLLYKIKTPTSKYFEYTGKSPLMSIEISDSTNIIQTVLDTSRLKKEVGDYEEIPISHYVHGMRFDTSIPYKYTISKAPLHIYVNNEQRYYGEENPAFNCTYVGFKNGETSEVLDTQPTFSTNATQDSPVGAYLINCWGAEAKNYDITYEKGVLTICKVLQNIDWEQDFSDTYVGDVIELTATSSSGLPVKYKSTDQSVAVIGSKNGKQCAYIIKEGIAAIIAYQQGDSKYEDADDVVKIVNALPTGISGIEIENKTGNNKIYDLQGHKQDKLRKGINIINRKKVLVK